MVRFHNLSDEARMALAMTVLRDSNLNAFDQTQIIEGLTRGHFFDRNTPEVNKVREVELNTMREVYELVCDILNVPAIIVGDEAGNTSVALMKELSAERQKRIERTAKEYGGTAPDPGSEIWYFPHATQSLGWRQFAQWLYQELTPDPE